MQKYVKPNSTEWIGNIPMEWKTKKLKYIADLYPQCNLRHISADTKVTFLPMEYIKNGYYLENVANFEELNNSYNCFCNEDILLAKVTPCFENGNIAIATNLSNDFGFGSSELFVVRAKSCNNRFLFYLFQSHSFIDNAICTMTGAAGLKRVSPDFVENYTFGLPPPNEQQAIAAFLDAQCSRIDGIITETGLQIELLKQYKTSLITETVTKGLDKAAPMKDSGIDWIGKIPTHWEVKRLKYLGTARNGLTYAPENISDDGILVLRSSNIQNGKLALDDNVYVNMKIPKEIIIKEDDILICSRNGSRELIGKCTLIDKKTEGHTYGAFMCVFRSPYNQFIHYVFQSDLFNYYLGNYLTSTINQLTNANLYSMKIPITFDTKELSKIVTYLNKKCHLLDEVITQKQQSIETMRAYKKSLIYEYVTGKKRVKVDA